MSAGELVERESVLEIASIDPLLVEAILPVLALGSVERGQRAVIYSEARVGGHQARVSIVDAVVDAAIRTFGVRLKLPNPDYELKGGLKCTVDFVDG